MFFNAAIILKKFTTGRETDAMVDFGVFLGFSWLGAGTMAGVSIAMLASALFSVYLFFNPIGESNNNDTF